MGEVFDIDQARKLRDKKVDQAAYDPLLTTHLEIQIWNGPVSDTNPINDALAKDLETDDVLRHLMQDYDLSAAAARLALGQAALRIGDPIYLDSINDVE